MRIIKTFSDGTEKLYTVSLSPDEYDIFQQRLFVKMERSKVKRAIGKVRRGTSRFLTGLAAKEEIKHDLANEKLANRTGIVAIKNPDKRKYMFQEVAKPNKIRVTTKLDPRLVSWDHRGSFTNDRGLSFRELDNLETKSEQIRSHLKRGGRDGSFTRYNDRRTEILEQVDINGRRKLNMTKKDMEKIVKGQQSGRHKGGIVVADPREGDAALSHEFGHIVNDKKMGDKLAGHNDMYFAGKDATADAYYLDDLGRTTPLSWKEIRQKAKNINTVVKDEVAASKTGIDLMKKAGYSPWEIKMAEKDMKISADTYRHSRNKSFLQTLANKIQIPSRRNKAHAIKDYIKAKEGSDITYRRAKEMAG